MPTLKPIIEERSEDDVVTEEQEKHVEQPQLWVDVIKGNRLPSNGIGLDYTAPNLVDGEVEVVIESQDVQSKIQFWENALILYAIGDELSMNVMKKFMMNAWNFVSLPKFCHV